MNLTGCGVEGNARTGLKTMRMKRKYGLLVVLACVLLGTVVQAADEKDAVGYWRFVEDHSLSVNIYGNGQVDLEFERVGENLYASGSWKLSKGRVVVSLFVDYWGVENEPFYTRPDRATKPTGQSTSTPLSLVLVIKNDQKLKVASYKPPKFKGRSYKMPLKGKKLSRDGQIRPQKPPEGNG